MVTGTVPVTLEIQPWERELLLDLMKRAAVAAFRERDDEHELPAGAAAPPEASTTANR